MKIKLRLKSLGKSQCYSDLSLDLNSCTHDCEDDSNDVSAILTSSWQVSNYNDHYSYWRLDVENFMIEYENVKNLSRTDSLLKKKKRNHIEKT